MARQGEKCHVDLATRCSSTLLETGWHGGPARDQWRNNDILRLCNGRPRASRPLHTAVWSSADHFSSGPPGDLFSAENQLIGAGAGCKSGRPDQRVARRAPQSLRRNDHNTTTTTTTISASSACQADTGRHCRPIENSCVTCQNDRQPANCVR
jgi:hypothetical protein